MKKANANDFPKLPKGYTWKVKYVVDMGQHSIRVGIVRFGFYTCAYKWHDWEGKLEDNRLVYPAPSLDEVRTRGIRAAESCWEIFTGISPGNKRQAAALALQDELNSGTLKAVKAIW